jgi:hypothetical protein
MRPGQPTFFGLARRSFASWFGGIWLFWGAPFLIGGIYVGIDTMRQQQRFKDEAQAQRWKPGDKGTARFDARAPRNSVGVGRA